MSWEDANKLQRHFSLEKPSAVRRKISWAANNFSKVVNSAEHQRQGYHEIIPGLLYLGSLPLPGRPDLNPFLDDRSCMEKISRSVGIAALCVSVIDFKELARSPIIDEPNFDKIKYLVLPMKDMVATVDSHDHTFDALATIKKDFYDKGLPTYVHCREGVGRSALIVSLLLSYLAFYADETAYNLVSSQQLQRSAGLNQHQIIFAKAAQFVKSIRRCVKIDVPKKAVAHLLLPTLYDLANEDKDPREDRSTGFKFLNDLAQSHEYKQVVKNCDYAVRYQANGHSQKDYPLSKFFNDLSYNKPGWYEQLQCAISGENCAEDSYTNHLLAIKDQLNSIDQHNFTNDLTALHSRIDSIREHYPSSEYSIGHQAAASSSSAPRMGYSC